MPVTRASVVSRGYLTVPDHLRGHPIYRDAAAEWRYRDDDTPTAGHRRACGYCALPDTPEGHDGCLGTLPGVVNACCGHGNESEAYVQYPDGSRLGGREAVRQIETLKRR